MTDETYRVVVASGDLRSTEPGVTSMPHDWTPGGVTLQGAFTGAHLLHAAVAGCVLNDCYREARTLGLVLDGVRVEASGGFDPDWGSTGITYAVRLATGADAQEVDTLLDRVDAVAEIPRTIRAGAPVRRLP